MRSSRSCSSRARPRRARARALERTQQRGRSGRRPGPLAAVGLSLAALTSANFAIVAFGVLAPELQIEFGFSKAEVGFLISLVFIGGALTSYPAGRLTDRVGPASVLGWALGIFAVAMLAAAVAPNVAVFLAVIALGGVAYGGVNPPTNVAVASSFEGRLGFFLSVKQSGVPLGGLVAGVVLPPIVVAAGWRWGLVTAALTCMVVVAATPLLRGARIPPRPAGTGLAGAPISGGELAALGAFGFVMSGTQWSIFAHLTLFLTEDKAFSLATAGLALGLAQGLGAGARLVWGGLSDLPGRRMTIMGVLSLVSISCLVALAAGVGGLALWVVLAATGITVVGWNGAYYALIADRAGPGGIGRASANALIFIFAGSVVMPPLLGLLVDTTSSWVPFWIVSAVLVSLAGVGLRVGLSGEARAAPQASGR